MKKLLTLIIAGLSLATLVSQDTAIYAKKDKDKSTDATASQANADPSAQAAATYDPSQDPSAQAAGADQSSDGLSSYIAPVAGTVVGVGGTYLYKKYYGKDKEGAAAATDKDAKKEEKKEEDKDEKKAEEKSEGSKPVKEETTGTSEHVTEPVAHEPVVTPHEPIVAPKAPIKIAEPAPKRTGLAGAWDSFTGWFKKEAPAVEEAATHVRV